MQSPKLTKILPEDFKDLAPGADLNRIIMANVLRYTLMMTDIGRFWIKDGDVESGDAIPYPFRPSTDLLHAMRAAEIYVDIYRKWKMRVDLSITGQKHWKATLYVTFPGGSEEKVCSFGGEDTALQICRCLVYAYLEYGPKDYEKHGWKPRKKGISRKP
ncbi:MAG: hypothetical protein U0941_17370 [Planctomycetaceae bacterium]